jgi:hypothetical protein
MPGTMGDRGLSEGPEGKSARSRKVSFDEDLGVDRWMSGCYDEGVFLPLGSIPGHKRED